MNYDYDHWLEQRAFSEGPIPIYEAGDWLGGASASGICINRNTILSSAPVVRALQIITGWIGKLPLEVYKADKSGSADIDEEHPAQWLLSHHPSDLYTPRDFKKTMAFNFLVHGSAYGWIQRDNDVDPSEVIILNPEHTGVTWKDKRLVYYTRINDYDQLILPENILHWKNLSWDGIRPINMLDVLRDAFSVGIAAQSYANHFYRNDATPKMVMEFPQKVDDSQAHLIKERWEKAHQGTKNSHLLGIVGNGGKLNVIDANHEASQFLQTREFEIACTISNIFALWLPVGTGARDAFAWATGWCAVRAATCVARLLPPDRRAAARRCVAQLPVGARRAVDTLGAAAGRGILGGVGAGPHRLSASRRRHASARRRGVRAQSRAAGRRLVSDQGSRPAVVGRRAALPARFGRRRRGGEQHELAVGGRHRDRHESASRLQSGAAGRALRRRCGLHPAICGGARLSAAVASPQSGRRNSAPRRISAADRLARI